MNTVRLFWILCLCVRDGRTIGADSGGTSDSVRTLDTPRVLTAVSNRSEWMGVSQRIRNTILVGCGLDPMPERTPMNPTFLSHLDRDGYTVDVLQFQPFPGVYVTGNLYRPKGPRGKRYPGVLNPHGHWEQGRLEQTDNLDAPARCVQFARMGMVALSYDMLGYQDTLQFDPIRPGENPAQPRFYDHHVSLFRDSRLQLWNLSLMGVQLWNSMRALDLLLSFPEVDPERIGCTGESGGGTQTFLLGAVDERVGVAAPVNMVSHTMQGGCFCENSPGLRVEFSNLDFAAAFAPRPMLLVSATGDWTKDMLEVEAPAIQGIYNLLGVPDRIHAVRIAARHNYNQASREAVYASFNQWLLGGERSERLAELPQTREPRANLKLPADYRLPDDALSESAFCSAWISNRQAAIRAFKPKNKEGLQRLLERADRFSSYWWPEGEESRLRISSTFSVTPSDAGTSSGSKKGVIILVSTNHPSDGFQLSLPKLLRDNGYVVEEVEPYQSGTNRDARVCARSPFTNFFNTYNRTILERRVEDIRDACRRVRKTHGSDRVILIGTGEAGLWCLLAAPVASGVIADLGSIPDEESPEWLSPERFLPGFRMFGGIEMSAVVAAHHPLWLYGRGLAPKTEWIRSAAQLFGTQDFLRLESKHLPRAEEMVSWVKTVAAKAP